MRTTPRPRTRRTDFRSRFGADPYLTGEGVFETVSGIQSQGVQACAKHFINKYVRPMSCWQVTYDLHLLANKNTRAMPARPT